MPDISPALEIPLIGNAGEEAVIVFFVLSGLVISVSAEKRHHDVTSYGIARLARLWSVVLRALLLTVVCDIVGQHTAREAYGAVQSLTLSKWGIGGHG